MLLISFASRYFKQLSNFMDTLHGISIDGPSASNIYIFVKIETKKNFVKIVTKKAKPLLRAFSLML